MRVVLDTNIFIAAALKGGFSEDIIKMAASRIVTIVCSEEILDELYKKLIQKFKWTTLDAKFFVVILRETLEVVKIKQRINIITRDPDDNKILECAQSGNADLIVSSDQDLVKVKKFENIAIVHPNTLNWIFPEYFKKN